MRRWSPLLAVLLSSAAASAQDPPPRGQEPKERKVVVTASPLNPKDVFDTPWSADVLDGQDRERINPRNLPELLKETPGVSLQKTAYGHGSPFIRGFTGFRNVMLIDGIRLNNSSFRDGPNQYWNSVDSYLIDRMELIRGPASVLHGSDAIGGTLLVETPDIVLPDEGHAFGSRSSFRWASAEDSYTARQEFSFAMPGYGVRAGGTYRDLHDLSAGRDIGLLPNTGYDEYSADLKAAIDLGDGWSLTAMAQHLRQDKVPRTHRTAFAVPWHGTLAGTDLRHDFFQERELFYAQLARNTGAWDAFFSLSYHQNGEHFRRVSSSGSKQFRSFQVNTPGVVARVGLDSSWGYWTIGGDFYRDDVRSDGHDTSSAGVVTDFSRGEIADDTTVDLAGIYLQNELTSGSVDLTTGLRLNGSRIDAGVVDPSGFGGPFTSPFDETYSAVAASLRAVWHADEQVNVIAGISRGFRAPNLDDTTAVRLVLSGQTDFPNPDLDPETSINLEVGTRVRSGPFEGGLFVFRSWLDDWIVRAPAPSIGPTAFTKVNSDGGFVHGIELSGRYEITADWSVRGDFTYAYGEVEQLEFGAFSDEPLPKLNPAAGHLGIRYAPKDAPYWFELAATMARHQQRLAPSDETDTQRIPPGGTPGYTILTARMGWEVLKDVRVTAAVENVTDKDYRVHGSGQNEPGTSFVFGLDARW